MAKKEELIAGLKNALDRGQSLDSAVQSFILAGYTEIEVHDAASALQKIQMSGEMQTLVQPSAISVEKENILKKLGELRNKTKKEEKKRISIKAIIIIAFLLLIIGGGVAAFFYMKYNAPDLLDNFLKLIKLKS